MGGTYRGVPVHYQKPKSALYRIQEEDKNEQDRLKNVREYLAFNRQKALKEQKAKRQAEHQREKEEAKKAKKEAEQRRKAEQQREKELKKSQKQEQTAAKQGKLVVEYNADNVGNISEIIPSKTIPKTLSPEERQKIADLVASSPHSDSVLVPSFESGIYCQPVEVCNDNATECDFPSPSECGDVDNVCNSSESEPLLPVKLCNEGNELNAYNLACLEKEKSNSFEASSAKVSFFAKPALVEENASSSKVIRILKAIVKAILAFLEFLFCLQARSEPNASSYNNQYRESAIAYR